MFGAVIEASILLWTSSIVTKAHALPIQLSDNIQSGASMVIYGGRGECAYTMNGAGDGMCVLEPCLTHAWVFAMAF